MNLDEEVHRTMDTARSSTKTSWCHRLEIDAGRSVRFSAS